MTIKPIINQKSSEKKENHGHNHQESPQQNLGASSRSNRKTSVEVQGSPMRNDVYEDLTRHRRSPQKIVGRSKRDHHHHKRNERERDRDKICTSPQYFQNQHTNTNQLPTGVVCNQQQINKSPKQHLASSTSTSTFHQQQQQQQQQQTINQPQQNTTDTVEEQCSGYNSGDEHLVPGETLLTPDEWKIRDEQFLKAMSDRGFIIQDIVEDGACLFRAISLQIYGDQEMHEVIRQQTMDYIHKNSEYFAHFVTEDINSYVKRKRNKNSHGNHIEIQAMSELYNRPVELYCYKTTPINIFNSEQRNNGYDPLRLSYQRGSHYNAIIDPYNASVGVGLGLAGYKPESQTREAIRLSEQLEIEKTMFEDKLKTTDWEATNEAIEEQIARESYLQWCRENMQKATQNKNNQNNNNNKLSSQNCTSSTVTSAEAQNMNMTNETVTSCILNETASSSPLKDELLPSNIMIKTNSDSNCDIEKIIKTDQQSPLAISKTSLNKKKNDIGNYSGGNCSSIIVGCSNNNNSSPKESANINNISIKNECHSSNSPCDSDDTDISSTSSVDQQNRFKTHSSKTGRRSRRKQRNYEIKRNLIDDDNNFLGATKRSCLQSLFQQKHDYSKNQPNTATATSMISKTDYINKKIKHPNYDNRNSSSDINVPCTSKQADADNKPVSQFYFSLLESSYTEDGYGQLSETQMLQKAIEMSRMDFFNEQKRKYNNEIWNSDDGDNKFDAEDEDSDTVST